MATFAQIIQSPKPVLIDFSAEWCGPCKMLKPILDDLKQRVGDDAMVLKIDVDRNQALAESLQIRSVPTLMLFKNGEALWRQSGVMSAQQLEQVIRANV